MRHISRRKLLVLGGAVTAGTAAMVVADGVASWRLPGVPTAYEPGAFDDEADYDRHDVLAHLDRMRHVPVWVSAGRDDVVLPEVRVLRARLGDPPGAITAGCHDARNWCRRPPDELAFLGAHP